MYDDLFAEIKADAGYDDPFVSCITGIDDPLDDWSYLEDDYVGFQLVVPTMEQTFVDLENVDTPDDAIDVVYDALVTYGVLLGNEKNSGGILSSDEDEYLSQVLDHAVVSDKTDEYLSNFGSLKTDDGLDIQCRMLPCREYIERDICIGEHFYGDDPYYDYVSVPFTANASFAYRMSYLSPGHSLIYLLRSLNLGDGRFRSYGDPGAKFRRLYDFIIHCLRYRPKSIYSDFLRYIGLQRGWTNRVRIRPGTKYLLSYMYPSEFVYHCIPVFQHYGTRAVGLCWRLSYGGVPYYLSAMCTHLLHSRLERLSLPD